MADTNITKDIVKLNADVATAFGVFLNGVDIISTIPSNANDGALKGTYCTAEFTGKSLVLYGSL
jgi:glutathione synthase/RimK-type ligase-like ATP-grasp enzyme